MTPAELSKELSKTALSIPDRQFIIDLYELCYQEPKAIASLFWIVGDRQSQDYVEEQIMPSSK